jgi:hypothetical protein
MAIKKSTSALIQNGVQNSTERQSRRELNHLCDIWKKFIH